MRKWLFNVGMWLLEQSGDAGYDAWYQLGRRAAIADVTAERASEERRTVSFQMRQLRHSVKLADGLISSGQPEEAQKQLRVALIASGGLLD